MRLFLNAHELRCDQAHTFWRVEVTDPRRRGLAAELRRELGTAVWLGRDAAWTAAPTARGDEVRLTCDAAGPDLHAFVLREAVLAKVGEAGYESWLGFGHEINCLDASNPLLTDGPVRVEPLLRLRVTHEGPSNDLALLVIRRSVRWRFNDTLTARQLRDVAPGEMALSIAEDVYPKRARVSSVSGDQVVLEHRRGTPLERPASDYTLLANPALVYRYLRGTNVDAEAVVRRIYQATGTIDANARQNRAAVKDRTQAAEAMLDAIGLDLRLPDGGTARIDDMRVQIVAAGETPMEFS